MARTKSVKTLDGTTEQERIEWVRSFPSGREWFDVLRTEKSGSVATQKNYAKGMYYFHKFTGKTPDEILEEYRADCKADYEQAQKKWKRMINTGFMIWVMDNFGLKKSHVVSMIIAIRSFFKHTTAYKLMMPTPQYSSTKIPPATMEEVKILYNAASPKLKAIIGALKDSGISRADFLRLKYGDIRRDFERGEGFIHVTLKRQKENVDYETFFGPNFVEAYKIYKQMMEAKGAKFTDETPLFPTRLDESMNEEVLSITLNRWGKHFGLALSPHMLRKFFETYMALGIRHPIILKYWMGHKLEKSDIEAKYIIPPTPEQLKIYKASYRFIDVRPSEEEKKREVADKIFEKLMNRESLSDEDFKSMRRYGLKFGKFKGLVEQFRKDLEEEARKKKYKQIPENELLESLQDGYKVVQRLINGEYIISKER